MSEMCSKKSLNKFKNFQININFFILINYFKTTEIIANVYCSKITIMIY